MSDRDAHKSTYYSGKKPYKVHNYRDMMQKKTQEEYYFHELNTDPMSELLKPYWDPGEALYYEYVQPDGPYDEPLPEICPEFACNDSMLDCKGGCTFIACICAQPPLFAVIVSDPTDGMMRVAGATETGVKICVGDFTSEDPNVEYPAAVVFIMDANSIEGVPESGYFVNIALVGCCANCPGIGISGDPTTDPDSTWVGTISPACPNASAQAYSNSGSCEYTANVSAGGDSVSVYVGELDCGSVEVVVTDPCEDATASFSFRINNTGQGGAWVQQSDCSINPPGCDAPFIGNCYKRSSTINSNCSPVGQWDTKYISARQNCSTNLPGLGCLTGCALDDCPSSCGGSPCAGESQNNYSCPCSGAGQSGWWWDLEVQIWKCVCP